MNDIDQIKNFLQSKFNLPSIKEISLLRRYTNDVYQISTTDKKYVLKIYGKSWRTEEELLFEVDLLNFLTKNDVKAAGPIYGKDKKFVYATSIDQFAILFEWADGDKPTSPFSSMDRELLGKATAKFHLATDNFKSSHHRQELNTDYLLTRPLVTILSSCVDSSQKSFFTQTSENLKRYIREFVTKGLDLGIVHADVTFDNIHITKDKEVVFYDFDSGGPGWRAIDFQGWAVFDPIDTPKQQHFVRGYRTIREINDIDIQAAPYLHAATEFWGIALDLARRVSNQVEQTIKDYLITKETEMQVFMDYFASHLI